jgi:hypothetical protein
MESQETAMILQGLNRLTNGEHASLRHTVGRTMAEADGRALEAFYKAIPPAVKPWQQGRCFTVMGIACLWRAEEVSVRGDIVGMLHTLEQKRDTNGIGVKIRGLLDMRWDDEDGYLAAKLGRLARMLRAEDAGAMPDIDMLFSDLNTWNDDNRKTQRRWAQVFFQN